jgi:hypothetical protein
MNLIALPLFFTALVLGLATLMLSTVRHRAGRSWDHWDTLFVSAMVFTVIVPTWLVYFYSHWYTPAIWSGLALLTWKLTPSSQGQFATGSSKLLKTGLLTVTVMVAWVTYFVLFCERSWHHAV